MRENVSALFVSPRGPYPALVADFWDENRDARKYNGSNAVVAHPPCNLWVNFAALNFKRWGGEHNRPGNDAGTFAAALCSIRRCGGVLEHPAFTNAWAAYGIPEPIGGGWMRTLDGEWVAEVWQSAYGHKARKRTWLLYVGSNPPIEALWDRKPGTHQCGQFDRIKPTLAGYEASRTPVAFAEYLVSLAGSSGGA